MEPALTISPTLLCSEEDREVTLGFEREFDKIADIILDESPRFVLAPALITLREEVKHRDLNTGRTVTLKKGYQFSIELYPDYPTAAINNPKTGYDCHWAWATGDGGRVCVADGIGRGHIYGRSLKELAFKVLNRILEVFSDPYIKPVGDYMTVEDTNPAPNMYDTTDDGVYGDAWEDEDDWEDDEEDD